MRQDEQFSDNPAAPFIYEVIVAAVALAIMAGVVSGSSPEPQRPQGAATTAAKPATPAHR